MAFVLVAAACGVIAAPAVAATNVVNEVQIQAQIFRKDPDAKALKDVHPKTHRQVKALIPRYRRLETRFRTAATAVSHSTTRTPAQRLAKHQWVVGARTFANGLHQLDAGLGQILHHKRQQARRTILSADRALQHGDRQIAAANQALGLR
jgi:hypothetical protein